MSQDVVVWQVRYMNEGETKLRKLMIETETASLEDLSEELAANELGGEQIISIRNQTLKSERKKRRVIA